MRPLQTADYRESRWLVSFSLRAQDERQTNVVMLLGTLAHEVVRMWLRVIVPDAVVFEPPGCPVRHVAFRRRADARRFIKTWGGRLE
jgi:hydrogenase maturation factor